MGTLASLLSLQNEFCLKLVQLWLVTLTVIALCPLENYQLKHNSSCSVSQRILGTLVTRQIKWYKAIFWRAIVQHSRYEHGHWCWTDASAKEHCIIFTNCLLLTGLSYQYDICKSPENETVHSPLKREDKPAPWGVCEADLFNLIDWLIDYS